MHEYRTAGDDDGDGARGGDEEAVEAVEAVIDDDDRMHGRGDEGDTTTFRPIGTSDKPLTLVIDVNDNSHPINHPPSPTLNVRSPRNGISGFSWLQSLFTASTNALFHYSFPSHSHESSLDDEHSTVGR